MDVGVGVGLGGGGGVHLQRHEVKEEVVGGLMDVGDRGEKRKVEDFSTLYSLDHGSTGGAPSHGPTTPPRSLPEQTGENVFMTGVRPGLVGPLPPCSGV